MWIPAAAKEHKGWKLEGANFPIPPHPLRPPGTCTRDNKACAGAARPALPVARPTRGAPLTRSGARAPERGRGQARRGKGRGLPYLQQHKEPEQRQEAASAARPRGQLPHRGADGDPGGGDADRLPCQRLTMANWGCSLRPWAPRLIPAGACCFSKSPCVCSLSSSAPGVLQERAKRCCSLTAKDGEGGDWSGRGSAAAATAAAGEGAGSAWWARGGGPAPSAPRSSGSRDTLALGCGLIKWQPPNPPTRVRLLWLDSPHSGLRPKPFHSLWDSGVLWDFPDSSWATPGQIPVSSQSSYMCSQLCL